MPVVSAPRSTLCASLALAVPGGDRAAYFPDGPLSCAGGAEESTRWAQPLHSVKSAAPRLGRGPASAAPAGAPCPRSHHRRPSPPRPVARPRPHLSRPFPPRRRWRPRRQPRWATPRPTLPRGARAMAGTGHRRGRARRARRRRILPVARLGKPGYRREQGGGHRAGRVAGRRSRPASVPTLAPTGPATAPAAALAPGLVPTLAPTATATAPAVAPAPTLPATVAPTTTQSVVSAAPTAATATAAAVAPAATLAATVAPTSTVSVVPSAALTATATAAPAATAEVIPTSTPPATSTATPPPVANAAAPVATPAVTSAAPAAVSTAANLPATAAAAWLLGQQAEPTAVNGPAPSQAAIDQEKAALAVPPGYVKYSDDFYNVSFNMPANFKNTVSYHYGGEWVPTPDAEGLDLQIGIGATDPQDPAYWESRLFRRRDWRRPTPSVQPSRPPRSGTCRRSRAWLETARRCTTAPTYSRQV